MSVYIWAAKMADYTAMQGPCPTGFHVPTKDERAALCWVLTSTFWLASNSTTMGTYLKMPMAGHRNFATSNVDYDGTGGYYWSSTAYSTSEAYYLYFRSSSLSSQSQYYRAFGFSMRCFKDTPVTPDSNWTTLYQGTWSAWVFRNSSLWLISVSWNWTTWYTIQDKNLWATTVYNQWDTLSDANCGYFYQWGNNYWFAHSWTITTSSTQVDASNYWPWNYYSSDAFITRGSRPYDWSSVQNDNLWWWVTWVQQTLKELKSAYLGEYVAPERLPSEYQEVEYIYWAGSQYLDIWNVFEYTTNSLKMHVQATQTAGNRAFVWWYSWSSSNLAWWYIWTYWSAFYMLNNTREVVWTWWHVTADTEYYLEAQMTNSSWTLRYWPSEWTYTATINVGSSWTHQFYYNVYVFCANNAWSVINQTAMRLYWLKIYNDANRDNLIMELVPCYRKADWVIWAYDIVNDAFYTNKGSGSFTKWPDVTY